MEIFGALAELPPGLELVRNALVKKAYHAPPEFIKDTYCELLKVAHIKMLLKLVSVAVLKKVEQALRRFHRKFQTAGVYSNMDAACKVKYMANVDMAMATLCLVGSVQVQKPLSRC